VQERRSGWRDQAGQVMEGRECVHHKQAQAGVACATKSFIAAEGDCGPHIRFKIRVVVGGGSETQQCCVSTYRIVFGIRGKSA
jgi:hypothetical protein